MIWVILLLALILRLITLNQSLWLDEAINVLAAKNLSFWDFVTKYPIGDFHPPGYFAMLWVWTHFFGFSEISVRLPSVILGVCSVFVLYLITKELFNKKTALLASFLLAIAPLHIYYSQEARMYSLAVFSCTLSFYFLIKLLKEFNAKNIILTIGSLLLVLSSDYVSYLVIPAQLIYVMIFERKLFTKIFLIYLVPFILVSPWFIFIFPAQLHQGQQAAQALPGWGKVVGSSSFKELSLIFVKTIFGRLSFDNKIIYGFSAVIFGGLYLSIFLKVLKKINKSIWLLLSWLMLPILLAFLISFYLPILSYTRVLFVIPAVYLILSVGLLGFSRIVFLALFFLIMISSVISIFIYYINPQFQREDWRNAAVFINSRSKENSLVIFEDNHIPAPFKYYYSGNNMEPGLKSIPPKSLDDVSNLKNFSRNKNIYVFEYLVDINDPQRLLFQKLQGNGWRVKQIFNFNGVGFIYLYEKV